MDSIIMGLNIMLIVLVVIIIALVVAYYFLVYKSKVNKEEREKAGGGQPAGKKPDGWRENYKTCADLRICSDCFFDGRPQGTEVSCTKTAKDIFMPPGNRTAYANRFYSFAGKKAG